MRFTVGTDFGTGYVRVGTAEWCTCDHGHLIAVFSKTYGDYRTVSPGWLHTDDASSARQYEGYCLVSQFYPIPDSVAEVLTAAYIMGGMAAAVTAWGELPWPLTGQFMSVLTCHDDLLALYGLLWGLVGQGHGRAT